MTRAEIEGLPGLSGLTDGADHVDAHIMDGVGTVRTVAAGVLGYRPGWMRLLWRLRVGLLKVLGQGAHGVPEPARLTGATLPCAPGEKAGFFEVVRSDGSTHWVAEGVDKHLSAYLAVAAEPLPDDRVRFSVVTVVRYRNRAGRIYFNVIRPFHHLVVHCALRATLRVGRGDETA